MSNRTFIFDFDGTIADTLPYTFKKTITIARQMKAIRDTDQEIIKIIRSSSYKQLMQRFKISWLKLPSIFSIIKKNQLALLSKIDSIKPFPAITKVLFKLKSRGIKLGILSSNLKQNIEKFIAKHKIDVFDFIDCESNIFGKDKAISRLIKKFQLNRDNIIYIGDEIRDIEACKKVKVKIAAVTWGLNTKAVLAKYKPDYLIDRPEELLQIINK